MVINDVLLRHKQTRTAHEGNSRRVLRKAGSGVEGGCTGGQKTKQRKGQTMTTTEKLFRDSIVKAYVSVMGAEKWDSLTNVEKDMVLHIMVRDMAKANGIR